MFQHKQTVLIDTNVIIEAHRLGVWNALAGHFNLHTVETIVVETQTGSQNRDEQTNIEIAALRSSFSKIYEVAEEERAGFLLSNPGVELDEGEFDLMVYASTLKRSDIWLLNSPDRAAVKYCCSQNWEDRVISLEAMLNYLKIKTQVRDNHSVQWLSQFKTLIALGKLSQGR